MTTTLTNLDKIFWPQERYTKGDVLYYYEAMAPFILPYVKNRPMVMLRHPNGISGESFFQKQVGAHLPSWISTISIKHHDRTVDYISVDDVEALLYVVNLGCIELNPFSARHPHLDNPDYVIIDLDPEDISFDRVIEVALFLHDLFDSIGMPNFCKTSGKRGLHIFLPLGGHLNFEQSFNFAKLVGIIAERNLPGLVSLTRRPKDRQQRVYIDYLRNSAHQTITSVYSLRPVAHATASSPLLWHEVVAGLDPTIFTIETLPQRALDVGDLWSGVLAQDDKFVERFTRALQVLENWALRS